LTTIRMGDDIGIWNIGAYHRGMMAGRTPNLDKLSKEEMLFTDYCGQSQARKKWRCSFKTPQTVAIRTG